MKAHSTEIASGNGVFVELLNKASAVWGMSKPAVGMLVAITAVPSMIYASSSMPHVGTALAVIIGIVFTSCAGAIFNQLIDMDIDKEMGRTKKRPLIAKTLEVPEAIFVGLFFQVAAVLILFFAATPMASFVALAGNAFYLLAYTTYLKRSTDQNIVIGGAAGAVGPLVGWAAISGDISLAAWLMFALVFFWTPSHFWALCLNYIDDYRNAEVPMLPVKRGEALTRRWIAYYAWTLVPIIFGIHYLLGGTMIGLGVNLIATVGYGIIATMLWKQQQNKLAMPVFHYSCLLLFFNFAVLSIDRLLILT